MAGTAGASLAEEETVGITEFLSTLPGFCGILKHLYSDFQVSEISLEGRVAELSNAEPPPPPPRAAGQPLPLDHLAAGLPAAVEAFENIAGGECAAHLRALLQQIVTTQQPPESAPGEGGEAERVSESALKICREAASQPQDRPLGHEDGPEAASPPVERRSDGSLAVTLPPISDKEQRKAVHTFFKGNPLLPALATNTIGDAHSNAQGSGLHAKPAARGAPPLQTTAPSAGRIQVLWVPAAGGGRGGGGGAGRGAGGRGRGRGRGHHDIRDDGWEGKRGEKYVHFILVKENIDTQMALNGLKRALGLAMRHSPWGFAGTKDKRGVTAQWVSAFRLSPYRLASAASAPWLRTVRVGDFTYAKAPLRLGALAGNRFRLVMRGCAPPPGINMTTEALQEEAELVGTAPQLARSCEQLGCRGFINYFGLQRFGTAGTPTHLMGEALLKGGFREAIDVLFEGGMAAATIPADSPAGDIAAGEGADDGSMLEGGGDGLEGHSQGLTGEEDGVHAGDQDAAALKVLPPWMVAERAIMDHLARQGVVRAPAIPSSETPAETRDGTAHSPPPAADATGDPGEGGEAMAPPTKRRRVDDAPPRSPWPPQLTERLAAEALAAVPRTLRMMYIHAWQSHVWNRAASHRLRAFGDKVVAGDLVLPLAPAAAESAPPPAAPHQPYAALLALKSGEGSCADAEGAEAEEQAGSRAPDDDSRAADPGQPWAGQGEPHIVTDAEAAAGTFTLLDVVLPLPGCHVVYPNQATADVYRSLCAAVGVDIAAATACGAGALITPPADDPNAVVSKPETEERGVGGGKPARGPAWAHAFSFAALPGDYRRLALRPHQFRYRLLRYEDVNDPTLLPSPLVDPTSPVSVAPTPATTGPGGPLLALHLDFALPPSAYATMLIRELTRQGTSRAVQASLTSSANAIARAKADNGSAQDGRPGADIARI